MTDQVDHLDSYNPSACCNSHCFAHDLDDESRGGPCWGNVSAIDELEGDGEWYWVHACKGHREVWDFGPSKYRQPE